MKFELKFFYQKNKFHFKTFSILFWQKKSTLKFFGKNFLGLRKIFKKIGRVIVTPAFYPDFEKFSKKIGRVIVSPLQLLWINFEILGKNFWHLEKFSLSSYAADTNLCLKHYIMRPIQICVWSIMVWDLEKFWKFRRVIVSPLIKPVTATPVLYPRLPP